MRVVPSLDERIALLERRQRDRLAHRAEVDQLIARRQREIDNLKGIRDAIDQGKGVAMGGIELGPMEIFVSCDHAPCGAQALVFRGDPEKNPVEVLNSHKQNEGPLPAGWTWRDGKTYCAKHS